MNTLIPRKHLIVLALSTVLAIVSYWIPLPRESQALQPETLKSTSSMIADATTLSG
jgi:hypothetical protein